MQIKSFFERAMLDYKTPQAFRTISEVGDMLDLHQHVLRFWETKFKQIKPTKRGGGRRYYRPEDIDLLRGIKQLLYNDGYTIKGVQKIFREKGVNHVANIWRDEEEISSGYDRETGRVVSNNFTREYEQKQNTQSPANHNPNPNPNPNPRPRPAQPYQNDQRNYGDEAKTDISHNRNNPSYTTIPPSPHASYETKFAYGKKDTHNDTIRKEPIFADNPYKDSSEIKQNIEFATSDVNDYHNAQPPYETDNDIKDNISQDRSEQDRIDESMKDEYLTRDKIFNFEQTHIEQDRNYLYTHPNQPKNQTFDKTIKREPQNTTGDTSNYNQRITNNNNRTKGLSKNQIRILQASLFELGEIKRILES